MTLAMYLSCFTQGVQLILLDRIVLEPAIARMVAPACTMVFAYAKEIGLAMIVHCKVGLDKFNMLHTSNRNP